MKVDSATHYVNRKWIACSNSKAVFNKNETADIYVLLSLMLNCRVNTKYLL